MPGEELTPEQMKILRQMIEYWNAWGIVWRIVIAVSAIAVPLVMAWNYLTGGKGAH